MKDTFQHAREKLEFDKIRERLLRHAASEPAKLLLTSLPVKTSLDEIRSDIARVSEMKFLVEQEEALPLEGIHPVREPIQRAAIEGSVLLPKELSQIASTARAARRVRALLGKRKETYSLLWRIAESLYVDKVLEYNLDQAIDENGVIRANASRELQTIRRSIAEKYEQLRKRLDGILRTVSEQGFTQDDIITTREGRMVIPVKSEHKNRVHGFIHSASASGATVFVEPSETLDLNNDVRSLHFQEQREIERILRALTEQVGTLKDQLLGNLDCLALIDALHAKAKYSVEIIGVEPTLSASGPIRLVNARHPILLQTHGLKDTVPLDIELGRGFNTLVISGPNAGGKSVAMKSIGLLALMVQSGLHIPASSESIMRVFDDIFVDIGDEQSIENDLSTFSSHLRNLQTIEEHAGNNSLVLIDEIGAGTDPSEGGAIAAAILESLTRRGALTVATTHHSALKVFAHETLGVENGAMEFDQANLTPTYRFKPGIPGSSYALEMAQRLGFDEVTLRRSREFMGHRQAKLEQLITDLESKANDFRTRLDSVETEKKRLSLLIDQYETKIRHQSDELGEMKRKAVEEAKQILSRANALIERSIREIKEHGADPGTVKQVREQVRKSQAQIEAHEAELPVPAADSEPGNVRVGDRVKLKGGVEAGELAALASDGKSAVVVFGSLKMRVPLADLIKTKGSGRVEKRASHELEKPQDVLHDLDVRGMTGEEAIPLVDKHIDNAMLSGLHRIDIIHGKGTGALRKKVTEFLSKHPLVKSYRLGEWNEGGTGATVVELQDNS